jgi:hypothetical protein
LDSPNPDRIDGSFEDDWTEGSADAPTTSRHKEVKKARI